MYTTIPKEWRDDFSPNVTLEELNDVLVQLHIPAIAFIAVLMLVGVFGNILVLYIYTTKYHSSTHRSFILWLAWIDLIASTVGKPLLIVSMLNPFMFPSEEACKTLRFLHVFFVVSSAFIVMAIAIERHRRICNPFSAEMSTFNIKMMCLAASVLGFIVAIPAIFVYGDAVVETGVFNITGTECFIDPSMGDSPIPQGYFMLQLLLSLISMLVLGVFYFRIGRTIWSHHQFIRENTYNGGRDDHKGKPKPSYCDSEAENNGVANGKHGSDVRTRETSPVTTSLDSIEVKKDPYGDLIKKVVKIKSRSNSPNAENAKESSRESTPTRAPRDIKQTRGRLESSKSDKTSRTGPSLRTKQVTLMLFIITVVFVLSFIPHLVLMVINSTMSDFVLGMTPAGVAVYNIFLRSFVINNMANPIIYGFCDKKFRRAVGKVAVSFLTCGRR